MLYIFSETFISRYIYISNSNSEMVRIWSRPILMLSLLPIIWGQFIASSCPKINGSVLLSCELIAPGNMKFVSITPDLAVNNSNPETYDRLEAIMGSSRFKGAHLPDSNLTHLSCQIAIFYIQQSDLFLDFKCSQLLEDRSKIQHSITLHSMCSEAPKSSTVSSVPVLTNSTAPPGNAVICSNSSINSNYNIDIWKVTAFISNSTTIASILVKLLGLLYSKFAAFVHRIARGNLPL